MSQRSSAVNLIPWQPLVEIIEASVPVMREKNVTLDSRKPWTVIEHPLRIRK